MKTSFVIIVLLVGEVLSFDFKCGDNSTKETAEFTKAYLTNLAEAVPKKFLREIANISDEESITLPTTFECIFQVVPLSFQAKNQSLSDSDVRSLLFAYNNLQSQVLQYILNNRTVAAQQKKEGVIGNIEETLKTLHVQHPKLYNLAVITNIVITFILLLTLSITVLCKYIRINRSTGEGQELVPLNPSAPFYQPSETRVGQNTVRRLR